MLLMIYVVFGTMLMYFIHLMLPKVLTSKINKDFSNLKQLIDDNPNVPNHVLRIHSATENLKESLPIFFACAVLSIVIEVNSVPYALAWVVLRVIYLFCYAYKLNPYRSIAWLGSIVCLILMALNLVI